MFYTNSEHLKRYTVGFTLRILCAVMHTISTAFSMRRYIRTYTREYSYIIYLRIHTYIYTVARAFLRLKTRGQYLHIMYNIYTRTCIVHARIRHCYDPFKSSYIPFCAETAPDDDDDDRRVSWRYAG